MTPRSRPPALQCSSRLSLPNNAVALWTLRDDLIEPMCSALAYTLSRDERARARTYRQERHRRCFIARRSVLRWLIGGYLSCKPESLRFSVSDFGKPILLWPRAAGFAFNLAHTEGLTLFAFAWARYLGVDVERRIDGMDINGLGSGIFSAIETARLDAAQPDPLATLLGIWTRKEALLKALGTGLSGDPTAWVTEDGPCPGNGRWRASRNGIPISGWTCLDLVLGQDIRGALAVSHEGVRVMVHRCQMTNELASLCH
ncbi:4'-phosphopantetheinyl transferase family protein [Paraburkholderia sp. GAS42]|jgi:4'-phosphopantetheinyl transferase|uniref:4'-phosphopantetheinyl transferase family protein n=1 Tax=Paraburkholderia sp. GAS42 TaxID=3035135 RepID=UPI003D251DCB